MWEKQGIKKGRKRKQDGEKREGERWREKERKIKGKKIWVKREEEEG